MARGYVQVSVAEDIMSSLTRSKFQSVVKSAIEALPKEIRNKMQNIAVVVEGLPPPEVVNKMGLRSPYDLLGLYQGVSLARRGFYYGNVLPDKITIYQKAVEAHCKSTKEMMKRIQEVVLHEIGHFFGLSEEQLIEVLSDEVDQERGRDGC